MDCKYCQSKKVIKYGTHNHIQRYWCIDCERKFVSNRTIPKMQYPAYQIAHCLNMYYKGMSLHEIRRFQIQQYVSYISDSTILRWVRRFSDMAIAETARCKPSAGDVWVSSETSISLDGRAIWFLDLVDIETRFLVTSHMSFTRTAVDAQELMEQACERTGVTPRVVYADKLRTYHRGIDAVAGLGVARHSRRGSLGVENGAAITGRFRRMLRERSRTMEGLRTVETVRHFLAGWTVHYNFFTPHKSLDDRTAAEVAGIAYPFRNWKSLVAQPFEKTARIPMPARPVNRQMAGRDPAISREVFRDNMEDQPRRRRARHTT